VSSAGRVDLDLGLDYKKFNSELNGISNKATNLVGGAFKNLGGIIAGAFAVGGMIKFGRSALKLASDLEEVQNVVDVTFGVMSESVNNFASTALMSFGLSELSAKRFSSVLGAIMKSSGLAQDQIVQMSTVMAGLAGDFASFYNLGHEEAFEKIRSGITGETEPLLSLGIDMRVASLEAYALSKGITKSFQSMSTAEQTLLRYNFLLDRSKDAQGDFARTSDSWANQTRLLNEQWKIFQGTIGSGLISILAPVVKMLNTLMAKLQIAAQYFKAFAQMITGVKQEAGTSSGGATASVESLGAASTGAGKAVKKAGKEVKGSLSNFDQLNVIGKEAADSMDDAAAASSDLGVAVPDMSLGDPLSMDAAAPAMPEIDTSQFQPILDFLTAARGLATEVGSYLSTAFGPTLVQAIDTLTPPILAWKDVLVETFNMLGTLVPPFKSWLTDDLTPFINKFVNTASGIFAGLLDSLSLVFTGIRDATFPIIEWFVTDGLPLITDFASGVLDIIESLFNNVKLIFDTLWSEGVQPGLDLLSIMIVDTLDIIKGFWDKFGDDIVSGITTALDGITELFLNIWDEFLGPIWTDLLETLNWLWEKHLKALVEELTVFIGKLVKGALDIFNKFILPIANFLVDTLGPTFANIFTTIGDILGTFLSIAIDIVKAIIKALGGIIDFIVGVFTGDWERAWDGIKTFFGAIFDGVVAIFKGAINLVIDGLNFLIRQLNTIKFDFPDWVPAIGGKSFGINIPTIPKLAQGGLIEAPTLAMVGDNKNAAVDPEVVSPLSKLRDMLGATNQAVVEVLFMILDAIERQETSLEIDGEKLTRYLRDSLRGEDSRVGRSSVTIGGVSLR
jgi:phage-related protein